MNQNTISLILAIGALIGAPVAAYLGIARRASGKIATSEASELWAESKAIRDWAQKRAEQLVEQIQRCETRIEELEESNNVLTLENGRLNSKINEQDRTIKSLRNRIAELEAVNGST